MTEQTDAIRARELAAQALDLERKHARAIVEALAPIHDATGADNAALRAMLQDAASAPDDAAALAVFEASATAAPVLRSAADFAKEHQPDPILWRDDPEAPDDTEVDAVLSVGEVAILASAGGLGKSTLVLELAAAAVVAEHGTESSSACGLSVAAGPVAVVSFEDAPVRIAHRLKWMNDGVVPPAVYLTPNPAPLWVAADRSSESNRGTQWDALWRAVRTIGCRLVVIDPVIRRPGQREYERNRPRARVSA